MNIEGPHRYTKGCECELCDGFDMSKHIKMMPMESPKGTIFTLKPTKPLDNASDPA